ncbi:hypothetical protein VOLCADRAFT_107863 [Volvox carteri f. nagariensis]|uniref:Uncharacterized protein n=1 Tax=Volvox carteri f. nagariensis TaxID=3068 RepID=D8UGX8_VOLCA|nr:uncharacterized protein VOLCADRAFT_107863 [Volvox carteri f. nagariensis]EFJ41057.1 hypothetical protein VOLCADRAFT_107863 [Volvox carteri f. nagariensis]|eukprot:XP_002957921.1 hypothetical protein VOLCADRAFT_107863 [Volvox carteri f. nagariensis]
MSNRPSESELASQKSEKISRVGINRITSEDAFQSAMEVSRNFPFSESSMFDASSVFADRVPKTYDTAGLKFLVEFLSETIAMFNITVFRPRDRDEPQYLLLYTILSKLALLSLGPGSLVILPAGTDDPFADESAHLDADLFEEASSDEGEQRWEDEWAEEYRKSAPYGRACHVSFCACDGILQVVRSLLSSVHPPEMRASRNVDLETAMEKGYKVVMLVEPVKHIIFGYDIWQPMATAIELAILNGKKDPVTVLLTDGKEWYFASVQLVGEISKQGLPRPTRNEFRACGYRFRLFACKSFLCDLMYSFIKRESPKATVFAYLHDVLYPGVDISQVAAQAERGSDALKTLADEWVKACKVDLDRSQKLKDMEREMMASEQEAKDMEEEEQALKRQLQQQQGQ